jgi:hypothetical protein
VALDLATAANITAHLGLYPEPAPDTEWVCAVYHD